MKWQISGWHFNILRCETVPVRKSISNSTQKFLTSASARDNKPTGRVWAVGLTAKINKVDNYSLERSTFR